MAIFVDVREPEEYADSHVAGAINLPPAELMGDLRQLNGIDKNEQLVLYCRTGNRSSAAMALLRAKGYNNLVNGINQQRVEAKFNL